MLKESKVKEFFNGTNRVPRPITAAKLQQATPPSEAEALQRTYTWVLPHGPRKGRQKGQEPVPLPSLFTKRLQGAVFPTSPITAAFKRELAEV